MQEGAVCQKLWDEKSSSAPIASLHAVQSNFLCVCHVETGKCSTCSFTGNDLGGCNNNENVINIVSSDCTHWTVPLLFSRKYLLYCLFNGGNYVRPELKLYCLFNGGNYVRPELKSGTWD